MKKLYAITIVLVLLPSIGFAQAVSTSDYSQNLGTSAVQCVPPDSQRKTLFIENPSGASNNVGYCVGTSCTPAIGTAGTSVLAPGVGDGWFTGSAPTGPIQCIGSGSTTPVNIRSGK